MNNTRNSIFYIEIGLTKLSPLVTDSLTVKILYHKKDQFKNWLHLEGLQLAVLNQCLIQELVLLRLITMTMEATRRAHACLSRLMVRYIQHIMCILHTHILDIILVQSLCMPCLNNQVNSRYLV